MRRALTSTATAAVLAVLAALASAQERTHVRDVRVGAHPGFERVVVELDGPAEIAWERGPGPGEESFHLDADLGSRGRVIHTKLAQVGTISLKAMRGWTKLSLEPRERRVRAYLLAKPVRLVIDLAAPGAEDFAAPKGVTPLAPAKSIGPLEGPPEPQPEPAPEPPRAELAPPPTPEPSEGASESAPKPPSEAEAAPPEPAPATEPAPTEPEAAAPATPPETAPEAAPEAPPEAAAPAPEAAAPAPEVEIAPAPVPEPAPSSEGFPWLLALGAAAAVAALVGGALALRRRAARPTRSYRTEALLRATQIGVEAISAEELRAADATSALEQRLDEEVRARVALEERLTQAGEELKVLRDRLHRVERRREEAP